MFNVCQAKPSAKPSTRPRTTWACGRVPDFSLSCIETHTTASTDPHRTDRIISNAYIRCVLMTSYGMRMMSVDAYL
ncbi:hypothetical protein SFRURICE_008587 [Spodoptera frugiperda]|nr:hypothetical protein SFRURICE_008587 [Spodoptera frugiperda]